MKTSDVPERPVLEFLEKLDGEWATWGGSGIMPNVDDAMPGVPWKLRLSKMKSLIRRKLVGGCGCGCRGDFVITPKGREHLARLRSQNSNRPPTPTATPPVGVQRPSA